ncbi:UDP-glucose 4-epimerase GalE [Citricoccus muralis]|uniref:UDP-glucose 4-epimerase n=1 Tax=Citricoccus muralis TaxID=169134 RepID=A0ABY8HA19_9MICC|nr:UDP-glucose 4-epimerase GalE [Citricoccus muralis]WFP17756.1 UDP-glucose 4-epimerase GalE [Citricoccus muralis]
MRLLVTGGAGYIGAHFVDQAIERGYSDIVVVDDLSTGMQERLPASVVFEKVDLSGADGVDQLTSLLTEYSIDAVVHFAAKKVVGDSVQQPEYYYRNNVMGTLNLLTAMRFSGTPRFLFSSSAAVYGEPDESVVFEDTPCNPINPYGETKRISELAIANATRAWGLNAVALRYFNVAGAKNALLADTTTTNLMPAIRDRLSNNSSLAVFGDDYETPDGTCVRDYVHVLDLVDAHLVSLEAMERASEGRFDVYNVGTGRGSSVLEVITCFREKAAVDLEYQIVERRAGDPGALTADVHKIYSELSWRARLDLGDIVQSVVEYPPNPYSQSSG